MAHSYDNSWSFTHDSLRPLVPNIKSFRIDSSRLRVLRTVDAVDVQAAQQMAVGVISIDTVSSPSYGFKEGHVCCSLTYAQIWTPLLVVCGGVV